MEEAPENGKESPHSLHANGLIDNVSTPGCINHGVSYSNVDKLGTTSRKVVQALVGYHCCIILCLM